MVVGLSPVGLVAVSGRTPSPRSSTSAMQRAWPGRTGPHTARWAWTVGAVPVGALGRATDPASAPAATPRKVENANNEAPPPKGANLGPPLAPKSTPRKYRFVR